MSYKILEAGNYHVVIKMFLSPWSVCDIEVFGSSMHLWAFLVAQTVKNQPAMQEIWVRSLGCEDPLEREWQPTSVFLPGEFHGQRSLVGYSPWGCKYSDTTDWITLPFSVLWVKIFSFTWLSQGHHSERARESVKPESSYCITELPGEEPFYLSSTLSVKTCFLII